MALGHTTKMRWNEAGQWIYSDQIVHPPIIDDDTFAQAQTLLAPKNARQIERRPRTSPRAYPLCSILYCGIYTDGCNKAGTTTRPTTGVPPVRPGQRDALPKRGLRLTYDPGPRTVTAQARLGDACTKGSCPRGTQTAGQCPRVARGSLVECLACLAA